MQPLQPKFSSTFGNLKWIISFVEERLHAPAHIDQFYFDMIILQKYRYISRGQICKKNNVLYGPHAWSLYAIRLNVDWNYIFQFPSNCYKYILTPKSTLMFLYFHIVVFLFVFTIHCSAHKELLFIAFPM